MDTSFSSFETEYYCKASGYPLNCTVQFNSSTGKVYGMGGFGHGGFEMDPDIAGIGVGNDFLYSS